MIFFQKPTSRRWKIRLTKIRHKAPFARGKIRTPRFVRKDGQVTAGLEQAP